MGKDIPLVSLGHCPAVSLLFSCVHNLLTARAAYACAKYVKNRKDLDVVQALPINNEMIPDLSILFSADTQTWNYMSYYE